MKKLARILLALALMSSLLTFNSFADVVIEKDAIGLGGIGIVAFGALLVIGAIITVIWVLSSFIIKGIRNKNVNK